MVFLKQIIIAVVLWVSARLFSGDVFRLETLEGGDADVGDQSVQLVGAVLILVTETGQSDTHSEWNTLDALAPQVLVQPGVDAHVVGSHLLFGKLLDLLDGSGRAVLEADA